MDEFLTFRIGANIFAMHLANIRRVVRMAWLSPVPESPADILGVLNRAGKLITVFDPRPQLEEEQHPPTPDDYLLITEFDGAELAFLIDTVENIVSGTARPLPVDAEAPAYVHGHLDVEGDHVTIIAVERMLRTETLAMVKNLQTTHG